MTTADTALIRVVRSMQEVDRAAWDACANPGWPSDAPIASAPTERPAYNPFICYDFLWSLEESGSATSKTGWAPQHLLLTNGGGALIGAMPAYLKSHSQGEYVFDHGWADAFQRAGGHYYPKLQVSVPFTPATGPRLLTPAGPAADLARHALAAGATEVARRLKASSVHATFLPESETGIFADEGYLIRTDHQFHFINEGYRDFDDFLESLASRKRKAIRRERRDATRRRRRDRAADRQRDNRDPLGRVLQVLHGHRFAEVGATLSQPPFLLSDRRADGGPRPPGHRATRSDARSRVRLNFIGSDTLFGRYWGATEKQAFLHFELCYYQAMEWGITHGMKRVEAGAQGEHKIARGYTPVITHSAHWIADPDFRVAVADYLKRERRQIARDSEAMAEWLPFKETEDRRGGTMSTNYDAEQHLREDSTRRDSVAQSL